MITKELKEKIENCIPKWCKCIIDDENEVIVVNLIPSSCRAFATVSFDIEENSVYLNNLFVDSEHRKIGMGRDMLNAQLSVGDALGVKYAYMLVKTDAPEWLRDFYKKEGFVLLYKNEGDCHTYIKNY